MAMLAPGDIGISSQPTATKIHVVREVRPHLQHGYVYFWKCALSTFHAIPADVTTAAKCKLCFYRDARGTS